jgi:hypothetical protein
VHNEGDTNGFPPPAFPVTVGRPYAARMPGGLAPMPFDGRPARPGTVHEPYDHAFAVAALLARARRRGHRVRP